MSSKNSCCKSMVVVAGLALTVAVGGVILWQFIPEDSKDSIENNIQGILNKTGDIDIDIEIPDNPLDDGVPNGGYQFYQCQDESNCCNGLDSICDLRANEIMYAGVHNAMAARDNGFWVQPNHQLSLERSLRSGYRAINIDMGKCDGELQLVHGVCAFTRDPAEVFTNIVSFLETNPSEVILLNMQIDNDAGGAVVLLDDIYTVMESVEGFTSLLYAHPDTNTEWPTLRELTSSKKQILFFHYNGQTCQEVTCPSGFHDWFVYAAETEFSFGGVSDVRDTATSCTITRGSSTNDFFGVNMFVTPPSRTACSDLNTLQSTRTHTDACSSLNGGLDVNVVYVDFWDAGSLPELAQIENEARATEAGRRRGLASIA
jgi:hypothetical protein